jgi:acyl-coenzyme A thioesterase PaaI-like protein
MKAKHPNYRLAVTSMLEQAGRAFGLDIQLLEVGPGWCRTGFTLLPGQLLQGPYISTGFQVLMAEWTAAAAATTLIGEDESTRTVEFRANLLRPAQGDQLLCSSRVLTPGSTLLVAGSEIFASREEGLSLVAKLMVTLSITAKE